MMFWSRRRAPRRSGGDPAPVPAYAHPGAARPPAAVRRLPATVDAVVRGPGQPLRPDEADSPAQPGGHDFGRVRIHSDTAAARSAEAMGAVAYTVGDDIIFGAGQYRPDTAAGRALLAHELAHVRQNQQWGPAVSGPVIGPEGGAAERDAGAAVARGGAGSSSHVPGAPRAPAGAGSSSRERAAPPARPGGLVQRQITKQREKPPLPGEHPEIAGIPSLPLRNLYRQVAIGPRLFWRHLVEVAVGEALAQERARSGEAGGSSTVVDIPGSISREGGPPPIMTILSDPSPVALDLLLSRPDLYRALEALPDDVAARYIDLLGMQLAEVARNLLLRDPEFRRAVQEAAHRRREQIQRRRERPPPSAPVEPEGGGTRTG